MSAETTKLNKKEIELLVRGFLLGKSFNIYGWIEPVYYDLEKEYGIHVKLENECDSTQAIIKCEPFRVVVMETFDDSIKQEHCGHKYTTNQDDVLLEFVIKPNR